VSNDIEKLVANPPNTGERLTAKDGSPVAVHEDAKGMYVTAAVDEEGTGWYLTSENFGLKVMIDRKDHETIKRDSPPSDGGDSTLLEVEVIRQTMKRTGLIAKLVRC